jgi:N-acetylglucosamine kinase-like BadF-type ATPase
VSIVLGVDGGGTKTHAAVADERGSLLGFGVSGPSNWEDAGVEMATAALTAAVREALSAAALGPERVDASIFGLAGIDFPSDVVAMNGVPGAIGLGGPHHVVNDSFVALRAGTNHPWGVVVISGTGSVVAGRNPAGETFRTLGVGALFGDDASASEISQAALGAVAADILGRGPHTAMTDLLCSMAGTVGPMELIEGVARGRIADAQFAPAVVEAAERGDLTARRILEQAGASLGDLAGHVARRLSLDGSEFELVLAGGMFRSRSRIMRAALEATVKRSARFAFAVTLEAPPVVGAVLLALEEAAATVDAECHARLAVASIEALNRRPARNAAPGGDQSNP